MSKRRATDELYGDSTKRPDYAGRKEEFTANLRALNSSFAQWVQQQALQAGDKLWVAGLRDYISHADKLLEEYDDVLLNSKQHRSSPPLANNLFGTPGPAAAAANGTDQSAAPHTAGAAGSGRKSVTFAAAPTFNTPAAAAATPGGSAAAATPGTGNTANAGHTPAPASGLGFQFAATPGSTPGASGSELPSPQPFKLGAPGATPGSAGSAGTSAAATPSTGFTFGNAAASPASTIGFGTPVPTPAAGASSQSKGFSFGAGSSSIPPAGSDSTAPAAAAGTNSSAPGFSFGAAPAGSSGFSFGATPAASTTTAAGGSNTPTFSFGVPPTSSGAAGSSGNGSSPAFGFATTAAGGSSTAGAAGGGLFKFPPPAAQAAAGEDGSAADDAGDEDGPPKHKLELQVDENKWRLLFNSKAKLHVKSTKPDGGADWDLKGVGTLTVRQPKDGDQQGKTFVLFTLDGGKQLVSSHLMHNSAVHLFPGSPKKCRLGLWVLRYDMPPAGAPKDAAAAVSSKPKHVLQVCMFSFGTADKVTELSKVIDEYKPAAE